MTQRVSAKRVVQTSFLVDFSDVILNVAIAWASGSTIMFAQALQGSADLVTSGLLLIGIRRSRRRADRRHKFGYGKEIYFWTLIAGLIMLTITATMSIHEGWQRVVSPQPIANVPVALAVLAIGIITNSYAFMLSYRRLRTAHTKLPVWATFTKSVLVETKATFILDLMGTVSGVFGLIGLSLYLSTGAAQYDGLGAIMIGITTAALAIMLMIDVKDLLIGRGASSEVEARIRSATRNIDGVDGVLDLRTMYIGSERLLVNMELNIDKSLKTQEIEQLMDLIKADVKRKIPAVHHIQLEVETPGR